MKHDPSGNRNALSQVRKHIPRLETVLEVFNAIGVQRLHDSEAALASRLNNAGLFHAELPAEGLTAFLLDLFGHPEHRLAVYGTLAPGRPNFSKLAGLKGSWLTGNVRGTLEVRGWGSELGYPGMRWQPTSRQMIAVHVLQSTMLVDHWATLDAFEGADYRRIWVPVEVSGEETVCNLYALAPNR